MYILENPELSKVLAEPIPMSLRKNGTNTFRKLSRNVLHIRIGCLRHLGNQIVAKHMSQTRTRSQTHDLLCGYP